MAIECGTFTGRDNNRAFATLYVALLSRVADAIEDCSFMCEGARMRTTTMTASGALASAFFFALACALAAGCSRQEQAPQTAVSTAPTPATAAATTAGTMTDTLRAKAEVGGVPSTYVAHFANGQLAQIEETRAADARGDYTYYGARLTKYVGAPLSGSGVIELQFNLQGALEVAHASGGESANVPDEQIRAVRNRADTLRSLAVTRHSIGSHRTQ
jgi:hypothetical protein